MVGRFVPVRTWMCVAVYAYTHIQMINIIFFLLLLLLWNRLKSGLYRVPSHPSLHPAGNIYINQDDRLLKPANRRLGSCTGPQFNQTVLIGNTFQFSFTDFFPILNRKAKKSVRDPVKRSRDVDCQLSIGRHYFNLSKILCSPLGCTYRRIRLWMFSIHYTKKITVWTSTFKMTILQWFCI